MELKTRHTVSQSPNDLHGVLSSRFFCASEILSIEISFVKTTYTTGLPVIFHYVRENKVRTPYPSTSPPNIRSEKYFALKRPISITGPKRAFKSRLST